MKRSEVLRWVVMLVLAFALVGMWIAQVQLDQRKLGGIDWSQAGKAGLAGGVFSLIAIVVKAPWKN